MDLPRPPPRLGVLRETLTVLELPKLLLQVPDLNQEPKGHGEPVMVIPGYGTGDSSTVLLRGYLRHLGYRVRGWGLGKNTGHVEAFFPAILRRLEETAERTGHRVRLIGWSLGGFLAREVARDRPGAVEHVVTMGSPVIGGPKYTAVAEVWRRRGYDLDEIEAQVAARWEVPLEVPVTAIYSKTDGVVSWLACLDRHSPNVEHVEVKTTHLGLGFCADVYRVIARRLAAGRSAPGSVSVGPCEGPCPRPPPLVERRSSLDLS